MIPLKKIAPFLIFMNCMILSAQNETGSALFRKKLDHYCAVYPREELYLHTDRSKYVSGEILWFNAYAVDWKTLKPSALSRIAYVELLNYDNRPVVRKRIYLEEGSGPGDISLPDTLSSGIYTIRAYTAWMKNFMPENFFVKELTIYNAVSSNNSIKRPVKIVSDKKQQSAAFPGFRLEVDNSKNDNLELSIFTDNSFRASNNSLCHLIIETRGNVNVAEDVRLTGEVTSRLLPKILLSPGVNHIAFITPSGICVSQKYVLIPPKKEEQAIINSGESFTMREKIAMQVQTEKQIRNISVSVIPPEADRFPSFSDYMIFGTEFGYEILQESGRKSAMTVAHADSLLMDASSNYLDWSKILSGSFPVIRYLAETDEHYLPGKLMNGKGNGDRVIMSIPGKQAIFRYAETDNSGNFTFELPLNRASEEVILEPDDLSGNATVRIGSPFSEDYPDGHAKDTVMDNPGDMSVNYQVQKIYGVVNSEPSDDISFKAPEEKRFYGKPDVELLLSDWIKLPTMDEIFFEIIPGTYLRKKRSGYEITVSDPVTNLVYDHFPSLFIDGVRVNDANMIAGLDPEYVEKIDVTRERYLVGDYMFTGIVSVITKAGDFSSLTLPDKAVRTYYRVIDPVQSFISPDYSSPVQQKSRIPDFRNTLWWAPSINTGNGSEFWSSDIPGDYKIVVNGFAGDGTPISGEKIIRIK